MSYNSIPTPPQEFIETIGSKDPDSFELNGNHLFAVVRDRCATKPTDRVLDIGCGCGRIATRFTDFLTSGEFDGIDVVLPMVEWCRDNISAHHPNFHFHHAALTNSLYSKRGASAATYVFPFPDRTFDTTFAMSVFTHLVPDSAAQYAREVARTLKPQGLGLLTFFLLTPERQEMIAAGANIPSFPYRHDGYGVMVEEDPERVIAYDADRASRMLTDAGLIIRECSLGNWAGERGGWTHQDAFLVTPQ